MGILKRAIVGGHDVPQAFLTRPSRTDCSDHDYSAKSFRISANDPLYPETFTKQNVQNNLENAVIKDVVLRMTQLTSGKHKSVTTSDFAFVKGSKQQENHECLKEKFKERY